MKTDSPHVVELLQQLGLLFNNLYSAEAPMSLGACANLLYGLQGCSCANDNVLGMITAALRHIDTAINTPGVVSAHELVSTTHLLGAHQSLCLSAMTLPDLDANDDLRATFVRLTALTSQAIETRAAAGDLRWKNVTLFESRLCNSLTDILTSEPFDVACGQLLHGFETAGVVTLHPGLTLLKADGTKWEPVLNVEVEGTSSRRPAKMLFDRLRNRYLSSRHGVVIETVPAEAFNVAPGFHRNILRIRPGLLKGLNPAAEDKEAIDAKLRASGTMVSLLSTINDESALLTAHLQQPRSGMFGPADNEMYMDDNLESGLLGHNGMITFAPRGLKVNYGMHAGWQGPRPLVVGQSSNINHIPRVLQKAGSRSVSRNTSPKDGVAPIISNALPARKSPPVLQHGDLMPRPPMPGQSTRRDISMDGDASVASVLSVGSGHTLASATTYETKSSMQSSMQPPLSQQQQPAREMDADDEIALLERQLEIARIEAKLLELRNAKAKSMQGQVQGHSPMGGH